MAFNVRRLGKDLAEMAVVAAGTIINRIIGNAPQTAHLVSIPIPNTPYYINGAGLIGGPLIVAVAPMTGRANWILKDIGAGMFADSVGIFGTMIGQHLQMAAQTAPAYQPVAYQAPVAYQEPYVVKAEDIGLAQNTQKNENELGLAQRSVVKAFSLS
ncbi:hypothetical protein [Los Azufres archaeal virus 1]|nr:hypothetical protein [Los Azufres archaeal virus 1]